MVRNDFVLLLSIGSVRNENGSCLYSTPKTFLRWKGIGGESDKGETDDSGL